MLLRLVKIYLEVLNLDFRDMLFRRGEVSGVNSLKESRWCFCLEVGIFVKNMGFWGFLVIFIGVSEIVYGLLLRDMNLFEVWMDDMKVFLFM